MPDSPARLDPSAYAKLILVTLFWGGTFVAGRMIAQDVPLMTVAFFRFLIATIILLLIAKRMEGGLPPLNARQFVATFALGVTGVFLYNLFFLAALARVPAGRTALLVSLSPILTSILAAIIIGEKLGWRRWMGIALGFAGVAIIVTKGDPVHAMQSIGETFGWGEAFMLGAILSWAIYTVISRFALRGLSPIATTTYAMIFGTGMILIGTMFELDDLRLDMLTWRNAGILLYLGALGSAVAFIWYSEGVQRIGAARTVVFTNLVPVFGVLLGFLILDEPVLWSMAIGGAIVIAGVTLTNWISRPATSRQV